MSSPEAEAPWVRDRRRTGTAFARLYAALAVAVVVVSCFDLYETVVVEVGSASSTRRFGSVWELALNYRGGVAGLGLAAVVVLAVLLLVAALVPVRTVAIPVTVALLGMVCAVLVLRRVGVREPLPELADGGQAVVAVSVLLVLVGTLHTVRLFFGPLRPRAGGARTPGSRGG